MDGPIPILLNRNAGANKDTVTADQLRDMTVRLEVPAEIVVSESPEAMREAARCLVREGCERLAVAGGDGTVHIVVQELAHTDTALGILPQGTFNNFATALRLPQDMPSALRVLKEGRVAEVSVGRAGPRYFTEAAGVGLFADGLAIYGNESNKNFLRGSRALLSVLLGYHSRRIRLTVDGETLVERAVMCTVANTYRMAQGVPIAPEARLTDEHLDVVIIGDLTRKELVPYYRAVRAQMHMELPKVQVLKARHVRVESRRPMNVHVDDQAIGYTPADIIAHPHALKVLVDRL